MRNTAQTLQHITFTMDSVARKTDNLILRFPAYTAHIKFLPSFPLNDPHWRFTFFSPFPETQNSFRPPVSIPFTPSGTPQYIMANIITVYDLWHEWIVEIGKDLVKILNRAYGAAWRKYNNVQNTYLKRKMVIDQIHYIASTSYRALKKWFKR